MNSLWTARLVKSDLTKEELAEKSGVSQKLITKIRDGRHYPGKRTAKALSAALKNGQH